MFAATDDILDKIWGCWLGKVAGGTLGMPAEGRKKEKIQKWSPPLSGWMKKHKQTINDDEQFEILALLAIESYSDDELNKKIQKGQIFPAEILGKYWINNLNPRLLFTAEKAAYENVLKHAVPWQNAGDEIYQNRYQNPYFDWIGAQMKGEIFGMFAPAVGWHREPNPTPESDYEKLKICLNMSFDDAVVAHRGVAVIGELFISAMVAIGIDYVPNNFNINIQYPDPSCQYTLLNAYLGGTNLTPREISDEFHVGIGISAEILIQDIQRAQAALKLFDKINTADVDLYYSFITPVISAFTHNPDARHWNEAWDECYKLWKHFVGDLKKDAANRLGYKKEWQKARQKTFKKAINVHTLLNNSVIVLGLLYGDGDPTQTMIRCSECGIDADCNAGNAGAILGAYLGHTFMPMYLKQIGRAHV